MITNITPAEQALAAQVVDLNVELGKLKKQLRQQSDLVETCVEAMNANADAGKKAEQENQRLRGEAGVMRGLLTECAGIILAIDNESDDESEQLDGLHEKIVLAIRGAE